MAQAKGFSADALIREAIHRIPADAPEPLRGLLAKYGPAASAEEIDRNRSEMFADFPRSDF